MDPRHALLRGVSTDRGNVRAATGPHDSFVCVERAIGTSDLRLEPTCGPHQERAALRLVEVPRPPRLDLPGVPQHVMVRGNNKSSMFFSDRDRRLFLRYLEEGLEKSHSALHAFVLMTNHVHLLATGYQSGSISRLVQSIGRRYSRYVNQAYRRTGTLFEGRFKSSLVDTESYLFTCMRYIELNPVRAGLTRAPIEYGWSSFAHNATGSPAWMLTPHEAYRGLGSNAESRALAYRALFATPLSEADLERIRRATEKGAALGSAAFEKRLEATLGRKVTLDSPGRPRRNKS